MGCDPDAVHRARQTERNNASAPVQLLPAFDAPLLAYADRTRIMTDQGPAAGVRQCRGRAGADPGAVEAEAHRPLSFTDSDATRHEDRLLPPP